ncbi:hypothetical protein [Streptomyces rimosus]|uniref:hypothetical protein n=1 Tax=Streptomyces rimosus TaxID=1927 RepID=UPI00131C13A6|nr:hypothetical protein [Streptomyces rimosus]
MTWEPQKADLCLSTEWHYEKGLLLSVPLSPARLRTGLRSRHATVVNQRIAAAQAAAGHLPAAVPVSWTSVRAAYTRPSRGTWPAYLTVLPWAAKATSSVMAVFGGLILLQWAGAQAQSTRTPGTGNGSAAAHLTPSEYVVATATYFVTVATASLTVSVWKRIQEMQSGAPNGQAGKVITCALELLSACTALTHARAGDERVKALEQVSAKARLLDQALVVSGRKRAGLRQFGGDAGVLKSHTRKVRAAITLQLTAMLTDRVAAAKTLGRYCLHITAAQAEADYAALLPVADLPADPGPDTLSGRGLVRVLTVGAVAAVASLPVLLPLGASGSSVLFAPLAVFTVVAVVSAAITGDLHRLAPLVQTVRGDRNPPTGGGT